MRSKLITSNSLDIIFRQNKKNPISTFLLEWENKSSRKNKLGIIKCSTASYPPRPPDYLYFLLLFKQFKKEQNFYRCLISSKQPEANNFSIARYIKVFAIKFRIKKNKQNNWNSNCSFRTFCYEIKWTHSVWYLK